jgi:hypothetical protein
MRNDQLVAVSCDFLDQSTALIVSAASSKRARASESGSESASGMVKIRSTKISGEIDHRAQ